MPTRQIQLIDPQVYGVSFSIKQCRSFDIEPFKCLKWLLQTMGFRRFRLMSYWNEHEKQPGILDFTSLDNQIATIEKAGGIITLCLGARQPRWPENHWPGWAWELQGEERSTALLLYITAVVERYKDRECIVSWQLENEALLKNFGERSDVNRKRLREEYNLIKQLDPRRPIIMTTSTSWGVPVRRPIPSHVGFSYYHTLYNKGKYHKSTISPVVHRARKLLIKILHRRPVFVHELQLEPWGPCNIWDMDFNEQAKSMSINHIQENIRLANKIKARPIDLWGGEWWYWRAKTHSDPSIWKTVQAAIQKNPQK
ncbi:MAG: hypothetical protein QFB86_00275 [Patescibacteria group bacterium]|nr:hypothetical protein [Patescibacteria group bacterium]